MPMTILPGILLYNMGDRLYTYEPGTTNLIPQLATDMPTISEDGLTYVIPLREGVKLHDRSDFNAEVMAHSLNRFIQNGGRPSSLLSGQIDSVEATGDYELYHSPITLCRIHWFVVLWGTTPVPPETYPIAEGEFLSESLYWFRTL